MVASQNYDQNSWKQPDLSERLTSCMPSEDLSRIASFGG